MKRITLLLLVMAVMVLSAGCGSRRELNELGLVIATGVDGSKGNYRITSQMIIPSALYSGSGGASGTGSQTGVFVFTSEGHTVKEALDRSVLKNSRRLYFSHNNIFVIGKETADDGIYELIDSFLRNLEARETVKVLVAESSAKEILEMLMPPEKLPGKALDDLLNKEEKVESVYKAVTVHEIAYMLSSEANAVSIPEIRMEGSEEEDLKTSEAFKRTAPRANLILSGLSLFRGEKRVGSLNEQQSLGVSWLMNQVKHQTLSFDGSREEMSSFVIDSAKVKVTPVKGEEGYILKVRAKANGGLRESNSMDDITDPKGIKLMETEIEREITQIIQEGWAGLQQQKVDVLGLADKIYRRNPKEWRSIQPQWNEQFAKMKLDIQVKVSIKRTGLFGESFRKLQNKLHGEE
ncbi:Ger(x)C family spore germination protein [Paenibacillus pinistramenti]|uniref:Ger(x)C family spore germination protein n=1 Tax=Paenibacillus pinistramenti TaxID=1768003 RepID=UPI001108E367|nr:Ger(x)C family spore germination protein [Paenibacillus pinistramenti]